MNYTKEELKEIITKNQKRITKIETFKWIHERHQLELNELRASQNECYNEYDKLLGL